MIDRLSLNAFRRVLEVDPLQAEKDTFQYKNIEIPKTKGPELFRNSFQNFYETDNHWGQKEIDKFLTIKEDTKTETMQTPLRGRVESTGLADVLGTAMQVQSKTRDILQESGSGDIQKGLEYFKNTSNKILGQNSLNEPLSSSRLDNNSYFMHGLLGRGQDITTSIDNINISSDQNVLQEKFLETEEMKEALYMLRHTGKPQRITINTVQIPTKSEQSLGLGKVKLRVEGMLAFDQNGLPAFTGELDQGDNIEVFTFPRGNREWYKEELTDWGREKIPFTNFRTVITGRRKFNLRF